MKTRILNIFKSFVMAFVAMLSLSCCGVGDEVLIDEIDTETTSEATETTAKETEELTTPEITTEETTETTTEETAETTTDETEEATPEEPKELTPEEIAILETLTDEEKEVWLSMPDIVTMRMLKRWDDDGNLLYTEAVYIDKSGGVKKIICSDKPKSIYTDDIIDWLNDQIIQNKDAEYVDAANIHKLIEFYNTFMLVDRNTKFSARYSIGFAEEIKRPYWFEIYGIRDNGEKEFETLLISRGDAENLTVRNNYTDDYWDFVDTYGDDTLELYLKLDPFVIPGVGISGHLVGEKV